MAEQKRIRMADLTKTTQVINAIHQRSKALLSESTIVCVSDPFKDGDDLAYIMGLINLAKKQSFNVVIIVSDTISFKVNDTEVDLRTTLLLYTLKHCYGDDAVKWFNPTGQSQITILTSHPTTYYVKSDDGTYKDSKGSLAVTHTSEFIESVIKSMTSDELRKCSMVNFSNQRICNLMNAIGDCKFYLLVCASWNPILELLSSEYRNWFMEHLVYAVFQGCTVIDNSDEADKPNARASYNPRTTDGKTYAGAITYLFRECYQKMSFVHSGATRTDTTLVKPDTYIVSSDSSSESSLHATLKKIYQDFLSLGYHQFWLHDWIVFLIMLSDTTTATVEGFPTTTDTENIPIVGLTHNGLFFSKNCSNPERCVMFGTSLDVKVIKKIGNYGEEPEFMEVLQKMMNP